ncbi:hypothetical protein, partial [Klebsiella grimontii]
VIYEYNPKNKPPLKIIWDDDNSPTGDVNTFQAFYIEIDSNQYAIDSESINNDDFEDNPDFTVDELMSN